ncbi:MAG: acyl-CoA thioesterase [Bacteroidales bacterium]
MVKRKEKFAKLVNHTRFQVRFSEVDSMRIVWHGEYVRYFEDGREAFGRQYEGIGYMDIAQSGYLAPMVELDLQYKKPLRCNDQAIVETRFIDSPAAKICFEYKITRLTDGEIVATGRSMQVFTNQEGELELLPPRFFKKWKERWIKE